MRFCLDTPFTTSSIAGNNWSTLMELDWYPHVGYKEQSVKSSDIPRRTSDAGSLYAYRAYLNLNSIHYDSNCHARSAGFALLTKKLT